MIRRGNRNGARFGWRKPPERHRRGAPIPALGTLIVGPRRTWIVGLRRRGILPPSGDHGRIMEKLRRLSDKIIAAHLQACEDGKMDTAEMLLQALQLDLTGRGGTDVENREATEMVVAAFELHRTTKAKEDS